MCMYKQDRGGGTKREEARRGRQVCVCTSRIEGEGRRGRRQGEEGSDGGKWGGGGGGGGGGG